MAGFISGVGKVAKGLSTATTGIAAAQAAWEAANKDGKLTDAAARAREAMATRSNERSALGRLGRALDAADEAIADFQPTDEAERTQLARWTKEATVLRSKTIPVAGYPPAKQKKVAADLRRRADALLDEIVAHGLEPAQRRRLLRRRQDG